MGIFFAISGWLITRIILTQQQTAWSLTGFYTRRCLRILPLYYVLILVACLSSIWLPHWKSNFTFLPPDVPEHHLVRNLLSFSTEFWRGGGGGMLVGHCWSLCVEERFYVFWPLLLTLWPCGTHARRALIAAMIVTWYTGVAGTADPGYDDCPVGDALPAVDGLRLSDLPATAANRSFPSTPRCR